MTLLAEYYNKFNEEKRFNSRHGLTEFRVSVNLINEYLKKIEQTGRDRADISIFDIGAGTGRYSIYYADMGYDVSAIELVKHNVSRLKAKSDKVKARQGDALNLKKYEDESFDVTLLFGPMYHLFGDENKTRALNEAIRVTKSGGYIFVAYCMNDYAVITHGFKDKNIISSIKNNKINESFKVTNGEEDLYDFVNLDDILRINGLCNAQRIDIISPDGPANYIREELKKMSEEEFEIFIDYQIKNCRRQDLLGAGGHTVDVLRKG